MSIGAAASAILVDTEIDRTIRRKGDAAEIFRTIVDVGEGSGGSLLALQAATRLCKLELSAGDANESGMALEKLYDGFDEGFDSVDLMTARDVLDAWKLRSIAGS